MNQNLKHKLLYILGYFKASLEDAETKTKKRQPMQDEVNEVMLLIQKPKRKVNTALNNTFLRHVKDASVAPEDLNYFKIANAFLDLINQNLQDFGINNQNLVNAKYGHWVTPIRLLMTKDKATIDDIRAVFKFLQGHEFWAPNIQSTASLRKSFQTLHSQQKQNARQVSKSTAKVSTDYLSSVLRDIQS